MEYFTDHWSTCLLQNSQIQFLIEIQEQYTGRKTSHTLVVCHSTPGEGPVGVLKKAGKKRTHQSKSVLERWILNYSTWLDNNTKWDQTDSREYLRDCPSFVVHMHTRANVTRGPGITWVASVPLSSVNCSTLLQRKWNVYPRFHALWS